jgi:hypothetical protein
MFNFIVSGLKNGLTWWYRTYDTKIRERVELEKEPVWDLETVKH